MRALIWRMCACTIMGLWLPGPVWGGAKTKLAKETAEYVVRKFGKEAAKEGIETLSRRVESLAIRHGDEIFLVVKKVGPRSLRLLEEAGEHSGVVVKLLARYGDEAIWVVVKRQRLALFVRYGDDAAAAMMKQGEVAEPLLDAYGKAMATALKEVSPQNGRRLAMMNEEGELKKLGRNQALLALLPNYGDRAMEYIWDHRRALQSDDALTPFLNDPLPYLEGQKPLPPSPPTSVLLGGKLGGGMVILLVVIVVGIVVIRRRWSVPPPSTWLPVDKGDKSSFVHKDEGMDS
jgi:hypothetical protein